MVPGDVIANVCTLTATVSDVTADHDPPLATRLYLGNPLVLRVSSLLRQAASFLPNCSTSVLPSEAVSMQQLSASVPSM